VDTNGNIFLVNGNEHGGYLGGEIEGKVFSPSRSGATDGDELVHPYNFQNLRKMADIDSARADCCYSGTTMAF